jgi:hypothetical protein
MAIRISQRLLSAPLCGSAASRDAEARQHAAERAERATAANRIGDKPTPTLQDEQAPGESTVGKAEPEAMLPRHRARGLGQTTLTAI